MDPTQSQFLNLLEQHQGIIHKIALFYTNQNDNFQDLYQEIILQAWISFKRFKGEAKFSTWLYKVALNTAINQLKKQEKRKLSDRAWESNLTEASAQDKMIEQEAYQAMNNAIAKLNRADKAIVFLYLEEKSYKEIAEILGITVNSAGVKISRIKTKLKQLIENDKG